MAGGRGPVPVAVRHPLRKAVVDTGEVTVYRTGDDVAGTPAPAAARFGAPRRGSRLASRARRSIPRDA